jgi:hypothetical protein
VGSQLRLIFISSLALLGALLPASSGAAPVSNYVHDVKVFHQVVGERARRQPAEIALVVGGKPIRKFVPGLKRGSKHFVIADVEGGRVVLVRHTGRRAQLWLDVTSTCRANPESRYFVRATVVIRGKTRRGYTKGDCHFVVQVLERNARAITRTTFTFEN